MAALPSHDGAYLFFEANRDTFYKKKKKKKKEDNILKWCLPAFLPFPLLFH
jgi:hypothetical protein